MTDTLSWIKTDEKRPPDDKPVEAMSVVGHSVTLCYKKPLWYLPDMSMYVYYHPKFWRPLK